MSETIAEKLLIKPNSTVWLNQPAHLPLLTPMPQGVRECGSLATAGTAVLFAEDAASVRQQLAEHRADLDKPGAFWIAYPKSAEAGVGPDTLGPIAADFGMRPGEQIAIDDRWSGLRFRPDRPHENGFAGESE
ncbi:hypothetical protein [Actinoplanes teichomyceticus]|uniref:DUF3052 family protein n=1 Tax=Actinoplanes teichomyceticus TaxID=1867 RepID=A0A561VQW0_ACTTI|nr:hypothetical protein [Actinoplanes teichomyceticus]TWG13978.1 hypothetical protein FHX34_104271 [Actinoplanes teichomyceticus]GIF12201.1 hypothetical protein Ate01nite_22330 [Actinoplanes teichomyceticus]